MKIAREWHRSFFRNSFYNPASPAALAKAPSEAAFILKQLKLKKGSALLDLCCGPGRHAVELAKKGMNITGYDYSAEYLAEAEARAKKKKVKLRLLRGDMRELPFNNEFDAAINVFTSFGYFPALSDDIKTLKGVARALKPGGLFLIDIVHGTYVRANFAPRNWEDLGDHYNLEENELTADGVFNAWTRIPKGGGKPGTRAFFNRLYDRARMSAVLRKAGLEPLKFWGGFNGEPLTAGRHRLIALARKPLRGKL